MRLNDPEHLERLLQPLRDLDSPFTARAIREDVLLHGTAAAPFWTQFKVAAAELLLIGGLAFALSNLAAPWHRAATALAIAPNTRTGLFTQSQDETLPQPELHRSAPLARHAPMARAFAVRKEAQPSVHHPATVRSPADNGPLSAPFARTSPLAVATLHEQPAGSIPAARSGWFASVQGGTMLSEFRILAERGELGFQDGWKTVALAYMTANGRREARDMAAHHPGLTTPILASDKQQQVALLAGATIETGPIELRALLGPAYLYSSSQYFAPRTSTMQAKVVAKSIGLSAEISASYRLNNSIEAGVTAVSNYSSPRFSLAQASGLFAAITYRFGS